MTRALRLALMVIAATCGSLAPAEAQTYPGRPIRIVVPFPPGAGGDFTGRLLAAWLSQRLGQRVIVQNMPGGNTVIGAQYVAHSAPDGYTLLLTTNETLAANPNLYHRLPYDANKDFAPISALLMAQQVFVVNPAVVNANSLRDVIRLAKAKPGALAYGSTGVGTESHLNVAMFAKASGIDILHVPYNGAGPAITALLAGDIGMALLGYPPLQGFIADGKLRPLAVGAHIPALPNVPTFAEATGLNFQPVWVGLLAPAGTPRDVVMKLNAEVRELLRQPSELKRFGGMGYQPIADSPEEFAGFIKEQQELWGKSIREAGVHMLDAPN